MAFSKHPNAVTDAQRRSGPSMPNSTKYKAPPRGANVGQTFQSGTGSPAYPNPKVPNTVRGGAGGPGGGSKKSGGDKSSRGG